MHRKPRKLITDERKTTIQIRTLNTELTCPICLGILHDTQTVMECLHRFCSECISKCLRVGFVLRLNLIKFCFANYKTSVRKKECPACRVNCSTKRHLRPDNNFDSIISQIYPNLEEVEKKEEELVEQISKNIMDSGVLAGSVEQGKQRQAAAKSTRVVSAKIISTI